MVSAPVQDPPETKATPAPADPKDDAPVVTDGGVPETQAVVQTDTEVETPSEVIETPNEERAPPSPTPDTRTEDEIRADERQRLADEAAETKLREDTIKAESELRSLGPTALKAQSDALKAVAKAWGVTPSVEEYEEALKQFTDPVEKLMLKNGDLATLKASDVRGTAARQAVWDFGNRHLVPFIYGLIPEAKHGEFTAKVNGKDEGTWLSTAAEFIPQGEKPISEPEQATTQAERLSALLPDEGDARVAYDKAVKGAKTVKAVDKAFYDAAQIVAWGMPKPEPKAGEQPGNSLGLDTMRAVRKAHAERRIDTDTMRGYQARNSRGQFPD